MPRKNDWEDQRHASPEYKNAVARMEKRMAKQSDTYDKLWYGVLFQAYVAAIGARERDQINLEEQKIRDRYAAEGMLPEKEDALEAELDAVGDRFDPEVVMCNDLLETVENTLKNEFLPFSTVEEQRTAYQKIGVINARASYEAGKEYRKWLDSDLLKDDPDKEAKAEYLTRNMRSRAQYVMLGSNALQYALNVRLADHEIATFENSFLADRDAFRKMTMRDFCRQAFMNEGQAEEYLNDLKSRGHDVNLDSNAYSVFEEVCRKKPGAGENREIPEEEVLKDAFTTYNQKSMSYYQNIGIDVVRHNLPPEEQKIFGTGVLLINDRDYKPPKSIREWIKTVADPLIKAHETEGIQTACEELKTDAYSDVIHDVAKSDPLSRAFGRTDAPVTGYQEYIRSNLGIDILELSFEEQRMHVARAMAADVLREDRIPFHEETILARAEEFLKSDGFSRLSNREISELVAGGQENIRRFRKELVNEDFALEANEPEAVKPETASKSVEELQETLTGRERTVASLTERKQRTELYEQNLDKMVTQAKNYLERLRKLAGHKKENSGEFENMERALESVSRINKNMSPQQIEGFMTQLGAAAGTYRKRIDDSWYRGVSENGRERRNLSEALGYFVVSQKGSLHTLRRNVLAPESSINRQMIALDRQIEDAKQAVEDAKEGLEKAETEAAIKAVKEYEAKETQKPSDGKEKQTKASEAKEPNQHMSEKVQEAVNLEEAYRKSLDPKAADYQEKLLQSAERSLFIQASVQACNWNADKIGEKKSAQILDSTMDRMLKAPEGNSIAFRAYKAEYLSNQVFTEHFAKQVMQSARQGKLSEADITNCRDEALKASFADRRADAKSLNHLKKVLGAGENAKKPERQKTEKKTGKKTEKKTEPVKR